MGSLPLRSFLESIVDYAGVFPPAGQSLEAAMTAYATYQRQAHHWMLGRFVLSAADLPAFLKVLLQNESLTDRLSPWPLSLLIQTPTDTLLDSLHIYEANTCLSIAAIEFAPQPTEAIAEIMAHVPPAVDTFFEISLDQSFEDYLTILKELHAMAKIRTGGLTAEAFPTAQQLAHAITACAQRKVPFKATAGLHHPFYGRYPLSQEALVTMHGFLNVALTAALTYQYQLTEPEVTTLLQATSLEGFWPWLDAIMPAELWMSLCQSRRYFFKGFGSCSFQEPRHGLAQLQYLSDVANDRSLTNEISA